MDKILEGLVKGVLSGDTVIISGKVDKYSDKAPEEYLLSLTLVQAPKVYNNNSKEEEPFGWESRNFLRNLVIGKVVKFTIDYRVNERCIGQIFLDTKNVNLEVVRKGYARVANPNKSNEAICKSEYFAKLQNAENQAKKDKEGTIWQDKSVLEKTKRTGITRSEDKDFDFKKVEDYCKGKEVDVLVEAVINCSWYVIYIKDLNCFVKFSPRFLAIPNNTKEPFIYKAGKAFVERIICHREYKVKIHNLDENKNFVGDLLGVKGDLVLLILRGGYTKVYTGTSSNISNEELNNLKNAQQAAINDRLRIWKNSDGEDGKIKTTGSVKSTEKSNFDGLCIQIHTGDSITVKNKKTGELVRIFLSHIKAPRLANANSDESDQPWAWQAKEYLRKSLVGKLVYCEYDFTKVVNQESKGDKGEKESKNTERQMNFFTVIKNAESEKGQDVIVNADLIRLGYANYVTPRVDDSNTSRHLDTLSAAFREAKEKKVGLHSNKAPGVHNYSDLFAANKQKIKEFKDFLVGLKNQACVVEHIISGSRVKLRVESKKCLIPFNLLGIKTFQNDKNSTDLCIKMCQEAIDFANESILQREGVCDIVQSDRGGNYFGYLTLGGKSYAIGLLEAGLAVVNVGMAGNFTQLTNYKKAEEQAKNNRVNIWKYEGLVSMLKEGSEDPVSSSKITEKDFESLVAVSEFVDFNEFYVNANPNKNLEKIVSVLEEYSIGKKKGSPLEPPIRKGLLCSARYSNDESFYRAIITRTFKDDRYEVEFIDYGTVEEVDGFDLIKLDSSIAQFEPQALSCELAFLRFNEHSMKKGLTTMKEFGASQSKQYYSKMFYSYNVDSRNKNGIVIFNTKDKTLKDSLQYELLELGLAKIDTKKPLPDSCKILLEAEKKAKTKGIGMWADTGNDDEENAEI